MPIVRGTLTVLGTGEVQEFMFNPSQIADDVGSTLALQTVPGVSFPVAQYGGGNARKITLDLMLFERGSARNRPYNQRDTTILGNRESRPAMDLTDDILFYQSLTQPMGLHSDGAPLEDQSPPLVLFDFGTLYRGFPCTIERVGSVVTKWSELLEPIEASLNLTITHRPSFSQTRRDFFIPSASR